MHRKPNHTMPIKWAQHNTSQAKKSCSSQSTRCSCLMVTLKAMHLRSGLPTTLNSRLLIAFRVEHQVALPAEQLTLTPLVQKCDATLLESFFVLTKRFHLIYFSIWSGKSFKRWLSLFWRRRLQLVLSQHHQLHFPLKTLNSSVLVRALTRKRIHCFFSELF